MTQQSSSGFASWESTPTLDSPVTGRVRAFSNPLFVREESVYGHSMRATTVRLVPFERSGQQECASFDAGTSLQSWEEFQQVIPEAPITRKVRMTAKRCALPELDWEF